ncbi:MAG: hypothetical protein IJL54_09325 [Prevotella sp.]|nr:hypothetical protein [Prevotella sp.]
MIKFVFFLVCFSPQIVVAQMVKSYVYLSPSTGLPTNMLSSFTDSIRPVFVLPNGEVAKWRFSLYTYFGGNEHVESSVATSSYSQTFEFDYNNVYWKDGLQIQENDCIYYIGKVEYNTMNGVSNSFDVKFDLLPSKPHVLDVNYTYNYEWECMLQVPNLDGSLILNVKSDKAEYYYISYSTDSFLFTAPDWFGVVYGPSELYNNFTNPAKLRLNKVNWGEYFFVKAGNQYGWVSGDTLCTTDYIKDVYVLEQIEMVRQKVLNINNQLSPYDIVIEQNNSSISVVGDMDEILSYDVYTLMGNRVYHGLVHSSISTHTWRKGLYIVSINNKHGKKVIIKYNKL